MAEDPNARAIAYGNAAVLAHLMRALVKEGVILESKVFDALHLAELDCLEVEHAKTSDIFAGAAGQVQELRKAFQKSPPTT